MSFPNSPQPALALLRDQIVLCPSLASAGFVTASGHHPTANPSGVDPAADALPLFEIKTFRQWRVPFADGSAGVVVGEAEVVFYLAVASFTIDAAEALIDTALKELFAQQVGLLWNEQCRRLDATEASAASKAADTSATENDFRTVQLNLSWGAKP